MAFTCQDLKQSFPVLRNTEISVKYIGSCYSYSRSRSAGMQDLEKQLKALWQGVVT